MCVVEFSLESDCGYAVDFLALRCAACPWKLDIRRISLFQTCEVSEGWMSAGFNYYILLYCQKVEYPLKSCLFKSCKVQKLDIRYFFTFITLFNSVGMRISAGLRLF